METARRHVTRRVPVAAPHDLAGTIIARLGEHPLDVVDAVFVVDDDRRLVGAIRLTELLRAPPARTAVELVDTHYPRIGARRDQEQAAALALDHGLAALPVVDDDQQFLGAIPAAVLLRVLRREHVEDLHRMAGIQREATHTRIELDDPPTRQARHRLPWLVVGLAGALVAALVVSRFERLLEERVAIAFFVPAIVYLADAIGTQTEAIAVRGLSLSRLGLRQLVLDELGTGILLGGALAALAVPPVALLFELRLAIAVGAAIVVAGAVATTIGLLLPWALARAGSDPALGSGPVATVIQDVLSLLIYFAMATWIA